MPLGRHGHVLTLTFAQRLPYLLAVLHSHGVLHPLSHHTGVASLAPDAPAWTDPALPLTPLATQLSSLPASVASALRQGIAAVVPPFSAAAGSVHLKRPRHVPVVIPPSGAVPGLLLAASEWRTRVAGERTVDINVLRATSVARHVSDPYAFEAEAAGDQQSYALLVEADNSPTRRPAAAASAAGDEQMAPHTPRHGAPVSSVALPLRASHRVVDWLWEVLAAYPPSQRGRFLQFVWGAGRLPPNMSPEGVHLTVQVIDHRQAGTRDNAANDGRLPSAHTCFMILELPLYSSKEVLRQRMDLAIMCQGINA
jgi:hypothetical protein